MPDTTIRVTRGEDFTLHLQFIDDAGDPYDLTGGTVHFYVRKNASSTPVISKTVTAFDNAVNGQASVELADADTDIEVRAWNCQVILTDASGNDHPSIYTTFLVTNMGSTTHEVSIVINLGSVSPVT